MKYNFLSVGLPNITEDLTTQVRKELGGGPWQVEGIVAYATSNPFCDKTFVSRGRWLLGLNDYITSPELLETFQNDERIELKVFQKKSGIFHPKLYLFKSVHQTVLLIGSGNMTPRGFEKNVEAFTLLTCETDVEKEEIENFFASYWDTGILCTDDILKIYKTAKQEAKQPKQPSNKSKSYLAEALAKSATLPVGPVLWIEIGKGMSKGREIEFPKAAAPFFAEGSLKECDFRVEDTVGNVIACPFRRRDDNGMWRITLNSGLVGTENLRVRNANGKYDRSSKIAVFTRKGPKDIFVDFVELGSVEHKKLKALSLAKKTYGRSSKGPGAREFGFIN